MLNNMCPHTVDPKARTYVCVGGWVGGWLGGWVGEWVGGCVTYGNASVSGTRQVSY
jgi:hypothetical protein